MLGSHFKKRLLTGQISKLEENWFIFFVSLLCMTVYIASDVFLPALPEMTEYFQTSLKVSQSVISIFMIGLSSTQIIHGILADRYGKKTILLLALPVFLISTGYCVFAPTIHMLIVSRFFQSIAASACIVIGRSLFSDLFEPIQAQKAFAILLPFVSLSPALAPAIGGVLAHYFNWRASFIFVFIFGLIVSAFVLFYLPESKPKEKRTKSIHFKTIVSSLICMLSNREFLKSIITLFMGTLSWWYYVCGSPIMFHKLGLSSRTIGILYLPAVVPYIIASFAARKMLKRHSAQKIYNMGVKMLIISCFFLPIFILTYHLNIALVIFATMLVTVSNGYIISMSMSAGIGQFKSQSGLAAGLLGTLQLFGGAVASFIVGIVGNKFNMNYFGWFIFGSTIFCYFIYLVLCYSNKKLEPVN